MRLFNIHGQALMAVKYKEQWEKDNGGGKSRSVVAVVGVGPATRESEC